VLELEVRRGWELLLTRAVVGRLRQFLEDPRHRRLRVEDADNAVVVAVFRDAEELLEEAGAKLHAAFNLMLDAAEQLPTPMSEIDLDRPRQFAVAAGVMFAGTRFLEVDVARAEALHTRWQAGRRLRLG